MGWKKWLGLEMTPERFARKIRKLMQQSQPGIHPVIDMENFRLVISEGNFFNLHNAYHAYRHAPGKEQDKVLQQFVGGMLHAPEVPATFAEVRPLLMPALRRKSMIDYLRREASAEKPDNLILACRELGPDMVLALAIDSEQSMSLVMQARLDEWGVSFDAALAVAMDNLRDASADEFGVVDGAPGVVCSNWCDAYDSSRVLLPDLMYRGVGSGSPVIMVPTREVLLLAPDNNPAAQLAMLALTERALGDSNRWCSTAMYQIVDGKLDVYDPRDVQVREKLRAVERAVLMSDYADQKEQIDKVHERDVIDIFVASYAGIEKEDGVFSYCTWTEGVESMLPKTDLVALTRPRDGENFEYVMTDWQTLTQRHADLMHQTPDFPPRFHVKDFPASLFDELIADKQRQAA